MDVAERIKQIRKVKGLSQQEVGERMQVDRAQYSRLENGKVEPTLTTLRKVADALEVKIVDLFSEDDGFDINAYDSSLVDRVRMIDQLDEQQKQAVLTLIDTALANKRLKDTLSSALKLT